MAKAKKMALPAPEGKDQTGLVVKEVPDEVECTHYVKVLDRASPCYAVIDGIRPACVQFYYHYHFTNEEDAVAFAEKFETRYSHITATVHASKTPYVFQPKLDPWQGKYGSPT